MTASDLTVCVPRLTLSAARRLSAAAEAKATELGAPENIAIVDESGHLILLARMDGAKFIAVDIAINKAVTAAGSRKPTHELGRVTLPGEPAFGIQAQNGGRFTTIPGGLPLVVDGHVVGAVGVSSASAAQDLEVAEAAAAEFGRMIQQGGVTPETASGDLGSGEATPSLAPPCSDTHA